MQLKPAITFDQYASDLQFVRSRRAKTPKRQWIGVLTGIIIGATITALFEIPSTRASGIVLFVVYILLWAAWKPYFQRKQKAVLQRICKDQHEILNGNDMTIDASGISGSWVRNRAHYNFRWNAFTDCYERPDSFLFLYSPCCWIRIPRSELSSADQETVLAWYKAAKDSI